MNKSGWVCGVRMDLEWHNSFGMVIRSPEGSGKMHSPPEKTVIRSRRAGPKNQLVNRSQIAVRVRNLNTRAFVRNWGGEVIKEAKNARVVHPQAFFMK